MTTIEQAFFQLHEGLARNSPGSIGSTIRALGLVQGLPPQPRVIDLGCGSGPSTVVLARRLKGDVVAVDVHAPFLEELRRRAAEAGLSERIHPVRADFSCLEVDGTYDLLWSEGAAYVLGFEEALRLWRPLVKPSGWAVLSELTWLVDDPSEAALAYWSSVYPKMSNIEQNLARAQRAKWQVVNHFVVPGSDFVAYYRPLKKRLAELTRRGNLSHEQRLVFAETERELELFSEHGGEYGTVYYVLRNGSAEEAPVSRRGRALKAGLLDHDAALPSRNLRAEQAAEQRFGEVVGELGLRRATELLQEIRERIARVIERG